MPVAVHERARTSPIAKRRRNDQEGGNICDSSPNQLKLIGDLAPPGVSWAYPLKDWVRRSFVGHLPGALPEHLAGDFFELVDKSTPWVITGPRWTAWMVKPPCSCEYGYSSSVGDPIPPCPWPDWMDELLQHVMPLCGIEKKHWPNSCNINRYHDGWECVGWHTDDEPLFQGKHQDCLIVSLSLGQARPFSFARNTVWEEWDSRVASGDLGDWDESVLLQSGDLCTMEGMMQRHYQHGVLKSYDDNLKPRLNLTWRWIVKHQAACASGQGHQHIARSPIDSEVLPTAGISATESWLLNEGTVQTKPA